MSSGSFLFNENFGRPSDPRAKKCKKSVYLHKNGAKHSLLEKILGGPPAEI